MEPTGLHGYHFPLGETGLIRRDHFLSVRLTCLDSDTEVLHTCAHTSYLAFPMTCGGKLSTFCHLD